MLTYLLCDAFCLIAHIALGFVACRERLYFPMAYAGFCAAACGATLIGAASDAFRAAFMGSFLPVFIAAWALYLLLFLTRAQAGVGRDEFWLSVGLLVGVGASIAVGFLRYAEHAAPAHLRTTCVLQMAVVVALNTAAIVAIGPRPLPELVAVPIAAYAPVNGLPLPEWGR